MREFVPLFLLLHILGAIVAFGPTFAFPIIGALAAKEPQHRAFVARMNLRIVTVLVIPFALSMAVTGGLLVWAAEWPLGETRWLEIAIAVYVVSVLVSLLVALPNSRRIAELASVPAGGPPAGPGGPPTGGPPPGGPPPGGPPPELLQRVSRGKNLGYVQSALLLVIVSLMVFKPTF